ncbi:MAG TPA: methyltransferase domain-containing protein [Candidatus Methylomirabilis sp.]|nr:methyltransferase domain-containing protein [Candidatus Methylomirabilis sp.]
MASIEDRARSIFGQRAARYTTSPAHADPQILARVVALAVPQPDWVALDIATGTGHTALALAPHVRAVIGIDLTPEMLAESAQLRAARGISNVSYGLADVHHLPFPAETFHLVTCRRAAHHFSHIQRAVSEMHRVLRVGGRLVIDDRSVPEDDFADACMNHLDRYHDASHVREYRPGEWRHVLEGCGFAVETVECYTRHRPLTALTADVSPENVRGIQAVLGRLTPAQQETMNLREVGGEWWLNHWYVLLCCTKVSTDHAQAGVGSRQDE